MDFRFTFSIGNLGARNVAEENSEALLDAFERTNPATGAAVGANLETDILEVTFCASGASLNEAADRAGDIFIEAAIESGLKPSPLVGLEIEAEFEDEKPLRGKLPLYKRRRGADAWTMPRLAQPV